MYVFTLAIFSGSRILGFPLCSARWEFTRYRPMGRSNSDMPTSSRTITSMPISSLASRLMQVSNGSFPSLFPPGGPMYGPPYFL